jgi:acetate---CoA ligase (ADP-forming)
LTVTSHPLRHMLEARSIAVVGASARPASFGRQMMTELDRGGYDGHVYPVNPRYDEVLGRPCYPEISSIGRDVDLALLGVSNALIEGQLQAAADSGVASAVIYASCYDPSVDVAPSLAERLIEIAQSADMMVCGGNCMGFLNVERGLRACGFPMPDGLEAGRITMITHSGSVFSAMAHNDRDLRFNLLVSPGQEFTTTVADYLEYSLSLESTTAIGLFLETVRAPERFKRSLAMAVERQIPVVALKVGRTNRSKQLVAAHSGALAGEDGAYEALFDAFGVMRVSTLDELADTLELFASRRRAESGGLAAIHDSGGERAMLIDLAADVGVGFASISESTTARLEARLEPGLPAVNPLDAWGTGNDAEEIYLDCMKALVDDPGIAALAFCVDLTSEEEGTASYVGVAHEIYRYTHKPVAVMSNLSSAVDRRDASSIRRAGIPVLEGTLSGLKAFKHLLDYGRFRMRPPMYAGAGDAAVRARWAPLLETGEVLPEIHALALLRDYGIPAVEAVEVEDVDDAIAAAERIGWPVVAKTAEAGIPHKTDAGGVIVGIETSDELRRSYATLHARVGRRVLIERFVPGGVELSLGIVYNMQFGPLVMVGAGGVMIEVLADRRFALPPLDETRARELIESLAVARLLRDWRSRPPAATHAVADALVAMSRLAIDLEGLVEAIDVNPLIAGPDGCVAVDALVVPRR